MAFLKVYELGCHKLLQETSHTFTSDKTNMAYLATQGPTSVVPFRQLSVLAHFLSTLTPQVSEWDLCFKGLGAVGVVVHPFVTQRLLR